MRLPPVRPQRIEALHQAGRVRGPLARRGRVADAQCIAMTELQTVDAELVGQFVHHRLVRDGSARAGLPPRPPPEAVGTTRTAWGRSRITFATSSRFM